MPGGSPSELIVSSLGSGSNGNAFLVECGSVRLLLDAGVPIRTLTACLAHRGTTPADLTAVLISHEHSDHTRCLAQLARRTPAPLFATRGTVAGLPDVPRRERHIISALETTEIGRVSVTPIPVTHDAREPVGFYIDSGAASVAILTDLGEPNDYVVEYAARADHLIIESNYDEGMLRTGPYPAYLKQRIRSADGHLSNEDCAELLRDIGGGRSGEIWLCHLSEQNNTPDLAVNATAERLRSGGIVRTVSALPRYDGNVVTWRSSRKLDPLNQATLPF